MSVAADALAVLAALDVAGVPAWLDGGWGVDALAGRQTRSHSDLDLVIALDQASRAEGALRLLGFAVGDDARPTRLVLRDGAGRQIDCHTVTFDTTGGGVQELPDAAAFRYSPEGFNGSGRLAGQPVACLTAQVQVLCHLGYPPDADDYHDMRLLHECCGVALPPPYNAATAASAADGPAPPR
jgi:lincosamide nucleotidyltransferase A/C/D/E